MEKRNNDVDCAVPVQISYRPQPTSSHAKAAVASRLGRSGAHGTGALAIPGPQLILLSWLNLVLVLVLYCGWEVIYHTRISFHWRPILGKKFSS